MFRVTETWCLAVNTMDFLLKYNITRVFSEYYESRVSSSLYSTRTPRNSICIYTYICMYTTTTNSPHSIKERTGSSPPPPPPHVTHNRKALHSSSERERPERLTHSFPRQARGSTCITSTQTARPIKKKKEKKREV